MMPETPVESPIDQKVEGTIYHGVKAVSKDGSYTLIYFDVPEQTKKPVDRNTLLDDFTSYWYRNSKGNLLSRVTVYLRHGDSGRSLTMETSDKITLTNVFAEEHRVYYVSVALPHNDDVDWWGIAQFLTNFKILSKEPVEAAKKVDDTVVMPSFSRPMKSDDDNGPQTVTKTESQIRADAAFFVNPLYPAEAQAQGTKGKIIVDITIDEFGVVREAVAGPGDKVLQDRAMNAAHNCVFYPFKLNGVAVRVKGVLTYSFGV